MYNNGPTNNSGFAPQRRQPQRYYSTQGVHPNVSPKMPYLPYNNNKYFPHTNFRNDQTKQINLIKREEGPLSKIQTKFIATHKDVCRVGVFSRDGTLAATGSADMSIKLLDVSKMHFHNQAKNSGDVDEFVALKPVLRTFYDNTAPVNDLDFHPTATLLISCSQDNSIKFFDHEKMIVKRAYNEIVERDNIRSVHFHPGGEYIISGGGNKFIRLINVQNFKVYFSRELSRQHSRPINQVRYNSDGRIYASCSKDGSIKIWDGQTNSCLRTIQDAHRGSQVSSVCFTEDSKLLLSSGCDSTARIWDVSTGNEWQTIDQFKGGNYRSNAVFFHEDSLVLCSDQFSNSALAIDRKTGQRVKQFMGHSKPVKWIAKSSSEAAFITCSLDHRARFWAEEF